jgi:ribosomal protein L19
VNVLDEIVKDQIRTDIPTLAPGDTVKVSAKVVEGNRERVQVFEGTILRLTGGGITRSLTVRRLASGVGVERSRFSSSTRTRSGAPLADWSPSCNTSSGPQVLPASALKRAIMTRRSRLP